MPYEVRVAMPFIAMLMALLLGAAGLAIGVHEVGAAEPGKAEPGKKVFSWGGNDFGDLGVGQSSPRSVPTPVKGLSGAIAIDAGGSSGYYQSLALLSNGTVKAWGDNTDGLLGNRTASSSDVPVRVPGLSDVTAISIGTNIDIALLSDGTVVDWGSNESGGLGNGIYPPLSSQKIYDTPEPVPGLTDVRAIAGGVSQSLALLSDGTLMAWGTFDEEATPGHNVPVAVQGLSDVTAVSTGLKSNIALLKNGTVMTWSNQIAVGDSGPPGTGPTTPVAVQGLSDVTAISAGQLHYLALRKNGTVVAWGDNQHGELGNGTTTDSDVPVAVRGLSGVSAISAGGRHSLALLKNGTVKAWGENSEGVLGNVADVPYRDVPMTIRGLSGITIISAGTDHSLASQTKPRPTLASPVPATTTTTTKPVSNASAAPCTADAITEPIKVHISNFYRLDGFGCSGDYAYAFAIVTDQQGQPTADVTDLLMATNGAWQLVSRDLCENGSVPADIYQNACETQ